MLIFSLRREARISGEAASSRLLREILAELGIACERLPEQASVFRITHLARLAATYAGDVLLVKMPTAAQLPFAAWATRKCRARVIFWIDGLLWRPLPWRPMAALLAQEPLLTSARALLNNWLWLALVSLRPIEIVVASRTQRDELAPLLPRATIHVVPNGSSARDKILGSARDPRVQFGDPPGGTEEDVHHGSNAAHPRDVLPPVIPPNLDAPPGTDIVSRSARRVAERDTRVACTTQASDRTVFGYLGHTYAIKGLADLLAAVLLLRVKSTTVRFLFALSGLGSRRIASAAKQAGIQVLGEVQPADFFAEIDALVLPLWAGWGTQTFPNVLLEALALGIPVITSDLPICRELFGDDLAIYVPPHQPATLAETLARIAAGDLALPTPERLLAHFNAHFSKPRITAGWRDILRPPT